MKYYQISFVWALLILLGQIGLYWYFIPFTGKYEPNKAIVEPLPSQIVKSQYLGKMAVTSYRSVPQQTDNSPFVTSVGWRVHRHGIAISRDLFKDLNYGDLVYIEDIGFKIVNDTMNRRHKQHLDIWVSSFKDERKFHTEFKGRFLKVWRVMNSVSYTTDGVYRIQNP